MMKQWRRNRVAELQRLLQDQAFNTLTQPGGIAFDKFLAGSSQLPSFDADLICYETEDRLEFPTSRQTSVPENSFAIYLGSVDAALAVRDLKEKNISAVLNMALSGCQDDVDSKAIIGFRGHWPEGKKPSFSQAWYGRHTGLANEFRYLALDALDNPTYDISQHFQECFDFIDECKREKRKILIHCMQGINRSAAIVVGYLCDRCGLDLVEALKKVSAQRPEILSNRGFLFHLVDKFDSQKQKVAEQMKQKDES